jgi:hypothetical protein
VIDRILSALCFIVTIAAFTTAPAAACDDELARSLDQQIRQARADKAWAKARDSALRLAGLYDGCASRETGRAYYEQTIHMANAMLSAGTAALESGSEQDAHWPFSVAQSLFSGVMSAIDAPADLKEEARNETAVLQKHEPWLVRTAIDPNVMPHARPQAATAPQPPAFVPPPIATAAPVRPVREFDVIDSWTTPFAGPLQALHVRVNLHPPAGASLSASDFRIVTFSRSNGRETVWGRATQAPAYRKTDWTSTTNDYKLVPTVDPAEDLGAQGVLTLHPGDSVTRVVTFVVRSDVEMNAETIASMTWNHR